MSYLDRLRALEIKKGATPAPTKPTEAPFVGFVGTPPTPFENIKAPAAKEPATATPATQGRQGGGTVAVARPAEADTLTDPRAEDRRQRVLAMLADRQAVRYAAITDTDADPEAVILALAIRGAMADGGTVTCELRIPREKYDPILLLDLIARHGGTVH